MSEKVNQHLEALGIGPGGKKKNEFTVVVRKGNKSETFDSCKILAIDSTGVTVEEMKKLGKNRRIFVPMMNLVYMRSELI